MKIYSWEELRKGKYASDDRLLQTKKITMNVLRSLYQKGWIESGLLFGSLARGDFSIGSDVDVLIISKPEHFEHVQNYLRRAHRIAGRRAIIPGVIHITSKEARNGTHSISPFLLRHFGRINTSNGVGKNPAKLIRFKAKSPTHAAFAEIRYLANAMRKNEMHLDAQKEQKGERYYRALGKAIDSTINAARRMLDISGDLRAKDNDSKPIVMQKMRSAFGGHPQMMEAFQHVTSAANQYKQELSLSLRAMKTDNLTLQSQHHAAYDHTLLELENAVRMANIFFLHALPMIRKPYRLRMRRAVSRVLERVRRNRKTHA